MSRSGYIDDLDQLELGRWRGRVASAIRGKRGQEFLRELLAALDALPNRRLITGTLETSGDVCAIGAVGKARGIDMSKFDPDDGETIAAKFGIASVLALEIVYMNDEAFDGYWCKTPEKRFIKMSEWALKHLKDIPPRRHGWTTRYYVARHLAEISRKRRNGGAET